MKAEDVAVLGAAGLVAWLIVKFGMGATSGKTKQGWSMAGFKTDPAGTFLPSPMVGFDAGGGPAGVWSLGLGGGSFASRIQAAPLFTGDAAAGGGDDLFSFGLGLGFEAPAMPQFGATGSW